MVADPLRLLHCCPISDGAAAVVLTAERTPRPGGRARAGDGHPGRPSPSRAHDLRRHPGGRPRGVRDGRLRSRARGLRRDPRRLRAVRADLARGHRPAAARARPAARRSTATPPSTVACPSIPRAASRRAVTRWRRPASPRSSSASGSSPAAPRAASSPSPAGRWPTPSAAWPPTTGSPCWRRSSAMIETIAASRCPRCHTLVAPPATYCPHHPVAMTPVTLAGVGDVVTVHHAAHAAPGIPLAAAHRHRRAGRRRPVRLPWRRHARTEDRRDRRHRGDRRRLLLLPPGGDGPRAAILAAHRPGRRSCERDRPQPRQARMEVAVREQGAVAGNRVESLPAPVHRDTLAPPSSRSLHTEPVHRWCATGVEGETPCRELTVRCRECACWTSHGCWPGRSAR